MWALFLRRRGSAGRRVMWQHSVTSKPVIHLKVQFYDMTALNIVSETAQLNQ